MCININIILSSLNTMFEFCNIFIFVIYSVFIHVNIFSLSNITSIKYYVSNTFEFDCKLWGCYFVKYLFLPSSIIKWIPNTCYLWSMIQRWIESFYQQRRNIKKNFFYIFLKETCNKWCKYWNLSWNKFNLNCKFCFIQKF